MSGRVSVRTVIVLVSHLCFKLSEAESEEECNQQK